MSSTTAVKKASRFLALGILRHLVLPLLRRFGRPLALIVVGLVLVFNAPQVLGVIVTGIFIVFALRSLVRR